MLKKPLSIFKLSIVLTVLSLTYGILPFETFAAQNNPCLKCHAEFKKSGKNVHAALSMGCETCHVTVEGKVHPQQKESVKLTQEMPELCYKCHTFKGKVIHSPMAEGKCTSCHHVHRSNFNSLLINNPPDLCYTCHYKTKFTKKYVHMVSIGRRCDCHNPHASDRPQLLSISIHEVCTGCHIAKGTGRHIVSLPRGKIHPIGGVPDPKKPKTMMSCASCHDPHSSDFPKLFTAKRICARCHKFY